MIDDDTATMGSAPEPGEDVGLEPTASIGDAAATSTGSVGMLTAGDVDLRLGGIGALKAEDTFVQWGGVGAAQTEQLDVELGGVGAVLAGEAHLSLGVAGSIAARDAFVEQSFVRTLIAQRVTVNRPTGVLVMIAQHVSGDVRPVIDWRGAMAAGAAIGLGVAVSRLWRELPRGD
jgi:hypothetical protein